MCTDPQVPTVAHVERHEEGRAMKRTLMSVLAVAIVSVGGSPTSAADWTNYPSIARCAASWPAPTEVRERAAAAMLPTYPVEPAAYRAEATLSIVVAGNRRTVAAGIGVDTDEAVVAALHTQACDGVLHVSALAPVDLHLWQLFEEWGVQLTQHCIGETCDVDGVRIRIDGEDVRMCPGAISIEDGLRIELAVD
jgi:hypothetical protein